MILVKKDSELPATKTNYQAHLTICWQRSARLSKAKRLEKFILLENANSQFAQQGI